jgi:hypothetical protein
LKKKTLRYESEGFKLGAGAGFEPATENQESFGNKDIYKIGPPGNIQTDAQKLSELCEVVAAWPKLSPGLRAAVLELARTTRERR